MLTLGQAAKETGLAKSAISRAIKTGRLSAVRQENGSFAIDPAELFRVYPRNSSREQESERMATPGEHQEQQREIVVLRELIEEIKGERDDLRNERDRLLRLVEEQAGTVRLLTHQAAPGPRRERRWATWVPAVILLAMLVYVAFTVLVNREAIILAPAEEPQPAQPQEQPKHFWVPPGST